MTKKVRSLLIALSLIIAALSCGPVVDAATGSDTCVVSETGLTCPSSDYSGSF